MKQTPFYKYARDHGAKFVDFAGWEMPLSYGSILEEHHQTRNSGGLFDVSHMGRIHISGRHARKFLEHVLTRRVSDMAENTCRYALICNEQGGVKDDVLIYRFDDHWMLVVNASNRAKVMEHFAQVQGDYVVKFDDRTTSTAMLAIQGPKVMDVVGRFSKEVPTLKRYGFCIKNLMILKLIISRTGYTGENGIEIILGANMANMAMKLLLKDADAKDAVVKPAGLGARDTLRIEAAMPLYGHELDEDIDPLTAGLKFAVDLDKDEQPNTPTFIGQAALKQIHADGPAQKRIGLAFEGKRSPRQGMAILCDGQPVGQVTSGCLSPTLGHPIAMAYVRSDVASSDAALTLDMGSSQLQATRTALPFYRAKA